MDVIKSLFQGTQDKFVTNKTNIEGLLSLDKTKPARKAILQEVLSGEIVEYEATIAKFAGVWAKQEAAFAALQNEIGDHGDLLTTCELKDCVTYVERLCALQARLTAIRHEVTGMDTKIDLMKVKIGELDIHAVTIDYNNQKAEVVAAFTEMNAKCDLLDTYAEECEDFASDHEEKELAENTKNSLRAFKVGISVVQTESVSQKLVKLENVSQQY